MSKLIAACLFATLGALTTGCATDTGISSAEYKTRMRQISLGMTRDKFFEAFPEAEPRGAKAYPNGSVEVLEVYTEQYSFVPTGAPRRNGFTGMEGSPKWFYFYKGQLVQYGQPNDWPADPDRIIEIRHR